MDTSTSLRFAVVGAGAIGSVLAWRLARAGAPVLLLGRGAHLEAIAREGLRLSDETSTTVQAIQTCTHTAGRSPCDVVLLATKSQDLAGALVAAGPLVGPDTTVIPAVNGLPWWYFHGRDGTAARPIESVDPGGWLWHAVPAPQIVGAVVHWGADVASPGHVRQAPAPRLVLGEIAGQGHARTRAIASVFETGGLPTEVSAQIRDAVWSKLLGNIATNALSVVTGATLDRLFNDPGLSKIVRAQMTETLALGAACGVRFEQDLDARIAIGRKLGAFRTSMLQDYERGRTLELAAISGAALELAEAMDIPMPVTRMVAAMAQAAERSAFLRRQSTCTLPGAQAHP